MKHVSELTSSLNTHFNWNKARMSCFAGLLLSLIAVRTVNLKDLAVAFASQSQIGSRYKRINRFFAEFKIDYTVIARWIFKLFFANEQKVYLIMDRTNWFWGKKKINIFMLAVAYEGLAIPIYWTLLDKAGSSNSREQEQLITRFTKDFGKNKIAGILGDREFSNGAFFKWLNKKRLPFYIRIKEDSIARIGKKKLFKVKKLFTQLELRTSNIYNMSVFVFGERVFLAGSRSEKGELMIVATNQHPKNAIAIYLRRWEVENLFQSLKSRGFNFESTRMTDLERLAKLMTVLAIGFCWCHKIGEWRATIKPIKFIQFYKKRISPRQTFFRYGLELVRDFILHPYGNLKEFRNCLQLLCLSNQEGAS
jgi:Transposase DDE domain